LIGGWNLFNVSLGPRILILKSIGGQIIFNSHGLLKDEEAIDWSGGFPNFHWTRGTSSRKVHEKFTKGMDGVCFFEPKETKEEKECVRKHISSYV
jgi:hypothetical protein